MAENEMADLGDMMIGTVPPLEFAFHVHEVGDRRPTGEDTAEVTIQIDGTAISAGGRQLTGAAKRRLAFYLMWNGKWSETEHDVWEEGRLTQQRFRYEPEEWPQKQGFAIVGFYSELLARSFWLQTSDEGVVTKLTADLDPHHQGFLIPDDYHSDELPLWRMRLQPRSRNRRSLGLSPGAPQSVGLQAGHDEPPFRASAVDQLLGGQARARTQVVAGPSSWRHSRARDESSRLALAGGFALPFLLAGVPNRTALVLAGRRSLR